jgi:hypothetical protein
VAQFKARSPDDLTILRAGMCPDCGAGVFQGVLTCKACGLQFDHYQNELPAPRAPAAPAAAPQQAPPAYAPPQQAPQGYAAPPQQAYAPQAAQPRPTAPPQAPHGVGQPLTLDDIELLERGPLKSNEHPLTDAEAPDFAFGAPDPLLGSSLSRAAIVVMADAAICDDPMVLLGQPSSESHVVRAFLNLRRSEAAETDDPEFMNGGLAPVAPAAPSTSSAPRAARPAPAPAASSPGHGIPLTLEDIEALERPVQPEQPHTFAELCDLEGITDPALGVAVTRGATVVMGEAAVGDDPLVLLGYPPVEMRDVARAMINLRRGEGPEVDDVENLLRRPTPRAATGLQPVQAQAHAAQQPVQPAQDRRPDPEATALLDQNAIRAAAEAVAREQAKQPNRVASVISARGAVLSLDDT